MRPKVLISPDTKNIPEDVSDALKEYADVEYVRRPYDDKLEGVVAILVGTEPINAGFLDKAPDLKLVARFGVGYDSVDVEECTQRGIMVTHTPEVLSSGVADHTWALILGYYKHIPYANSHVRTRWAKREGAVPFGWDTEGKTLGILGLGRIGLEVLMRSRGFPMKVIYHDLIRKKKLEEKYGVEYVIFDKLLEKSDILTIHVDLNPSSRGIIGSEELEKMKTSSLIVNTSRGPVINESALVDALRNGKIAGAALDVFEKEPTPLDNTLLSMPNVLATPHIASASWETRKKMAIRSTGNVLSYLKGERPPHIVREQSTVEFPLRQ
ncbi:D-glycerate dehydrogenase [Candidatus Bathyarchaeota archaeon]|jgi:lactate dehydrogenase-like 2-hydroxyacid dehydrogenase|nr:D-glycerate dehydrogenase [Candidatus Bathyarchaeota archaeon]MBT4423618.1 D-glycerate dehydrogenase [Candidatus Bathyarchaeota archaeon]MBT6605821.1 D-glycerate dehydrogenase [Candidatus Bathyarchaeota archaeon]MBT7185961.1 D-glycerate dehydrogenase [Candidatus Bathyarchaeota archaeon]MBT7347525.1 D-glycerate dehydrogenase [Candidatus Bathyarchaeota archaeon]